jgi:hypothetical protein
LLSPLRVAGVIDGERADSKPRRFVAEYRIDPNPTQAAIPAGYDYQ